MRRFLIHSVCVGIVVSAVGTISYFESKGVQTLWTLYQKKKKFDQELVLLKQELEALQHTIQIFKHDRRYRERVIRLQTGYLAENELLVEWPE